MGAYKRGLLEYIFGWAGPSGYGSGSVAEEVLSGEKGLSNRVVLLTGGTSPIAKEACVALCRHGAHVVLGCRSLEAGHATAAQVQEGMPQAQVTCLQCDLSSLATTCSFAQSFQALGLPLHVLICNASTSSSTFQLSPNGFETQFAVDYLSHALLAQLLLPLLACSAQVAGAPGRIIFVTCSAHYLSYHIPHGGQAAGFSWQLVEGPEAATMFLPTQAFGLAKLAQIQFVCGLQKHIQEERPGLPVTVNAVHPGITADGLKRYGGYNADTWVHYLKSCLSDGLQYMGALKTCAQAAASVVYAAASHELDGVSGQYLEDCNVSLPSVQAQDPAAAAKLWQMTQDALGYRLGPNWQDLLAHDTAQAATAAAAGVLVPIADGMQP